MNEYTADDVTALHNRISELETQLANKEQALEFQLTYNKRNAERRDRLDLWLTESADELDATLLAELCEMFDLETHIEREVTLSISATHTIKLPRGYDLSDLSQYDFEVEVTYSGDGEVTWSDVSVDDINY
jgi:hypothetical protein